MNDLERVCARSEEEAKQFYEKVNIFGATREEIDKVFLGEIPLDTLDHPIWVSLDRLKTEEIGKPRLWKPWASTFLTAMTYRDFISRDERQAPYLILN